MCPCNTKYMYIGKADCNFICISKRTGLKLKKYDIQDPNLQNSIQKKKSYNN